MSKNLFEIQINMGGKSGHRFGISGTDEFIKSGRMEDHNIITRGAPFNNSAQFDTVGGPNEEGNTDFIRGARDFSKHRKDFEFAGTSGRLHFTDSPWLDRSLDGGDDTLLYSSQNILRFLGIDRKFGSHPHRELSQSLWRKRCQTYNPRHVKCGQGIWFYNARGSGYGYNGSGSWHNTSYRDEIIRSYDEEGHEYTRETNQLGQEGSKRRQESSKKVFENLYGLPFLRQDKSEKEQSDKKSCGSSQRSYKRNRTIKNRKRRVQSTIAKRSKRYFSYERAWSEITISNIVLAQDGKSSTRQDNFAMEKHTKGNSKRKDRQDGRVWKKVDHQLLQWGICTTCRSGKRKDIRSALCNRITEPSFRSFWGKPNNLRNRSWYVVRREHISMSNGPSEKDWYTTKRKSKTYGQPKGLQAFKKSSSRYRTTDWAFKTAWAGQKPNEKRYWGSYKWLPVCPFIQLSPSYERYELTGSELEKNNRIPEKVLMNNRKYN